MQFDHANFLKEDIEPVSRWRHFLGLPSPLFRLPRNTILNVIHPDTEANSPSSVMDARVKLVSGNPLVDTLEKSLSFSLQQLLKLRY